MDELPPDPLGIDDEIGPSDRAISLARAWLFVIAAVWFFLGLGALISGVGFFGLPLAGLSIGVVFIAISRFAPRRVAIFFALMS